jgi:hypothetical protein
MFNTYIYHKIPPSYFGVGCTIIKETIALLAQELRFLQCCYISCATKCKMYRFVLNLQCCYSAVTVFKAICTSSFCVLKKS